ncbi:MAG: sigma-70 family RNA polymerase sigma factor [Acidobacteriota bacterium]
MTTGTAGEIVPLRLASSTDTTSRCLRSDDETFADLVRTHQDAVVRYVTRLVGDRSRAEDVAQEAFVRFFRHRQRYEERGTAAAYLYRIATNLVRSDERRRRRWRRLAPQWSLGGSSPDGVQTERHPRDPDPQHRALSSEIDREVRDAIASLDLPLRAPLVLREIEGLSYREIADALGCRIGTVKSRIHRARARLKELLEPYWCDGRGEPSRLHRPPSGGADV